MFSIALSAIKVMRATRQRRKLENIAQLAQSIKLNGLIKPIVLTSDNVLIAGERRLEAVRSLGHTHINAIYSTAETERQRELIELSENVDRVDLPWRDFVATVIRYTALRKEMGEHTKKQLAEELNISWQKFHQCMQIQSAIDAGHADINNSINFSIASSLAERIASRQKQEEIESIRPIGSPAPHADIDETISTAELTSAALETDEAALPFSFFNVDFFDWAPQYEGRRFNFLHCDFPYGINFGKSKYNTVAGAHFAVYEDDPDIYWSLIMHLHTYTERLVADDAHMLFWFTPKYYEVTRISLEKMGWRVNPIPLIWFKSDGMGILPDPKRGPRQVYEMAFLCTRGQRLLLRAGNNCIPAPTSREAHTSEKNLTMLGTIFSMLVDTSTYMLDPTAGSGNALLAAYRLGGRAVGLEYDASIHTTGTQHLLSILAGEPL